MSGAPQWVWNCYVHGRPCRADESGGANSLDDAKTLFRTVWEAFGPGSPDTTWPWRTGTPRPAPRHWRGTTGRAAKRRSPLGNRLEPLARNVFIQINTDRDRRKPIPQKREVEIRVSKSSTRDADAVSRSPGNSCVHDNLQIPHDAPIGSVIRIRVHFTDAGNSSVLPRTTLPGSQVP
jgi:hypothetical protein